MSPLAKGLMILVIHVCLVMALGGKLLYDRATLPRVWVSAVPYDPQLPIRGRYVSLQLIVEPRGVDEAKTKSESQRAQSVSLRVEDGRLLAEPKKSVIYDPSDLRVRFLTVDNKRTAALSEPVAFFIPEHIPDPSLRPSGERLYVEATIPKKGAPRPIRLGVSNDDGPIVPLEIK